MSQNTSQTSSGYGARPVSVDIARGRSMREAASPNGVGVVKTSGLPLTNQVVADRLSLAHWPRSHQIFVCSLAGGTGRTTVAGLMATVLAELPYAHIWHPVGLVDAAPQTLCRTRRRWDVIEPPEPAADLTSDQACTRSGAWTLSGLPSNSERLDFSVLVVDSSAGLPSAVPGVDEDPSASIVLVTRPDRVSLADAADALVAMNDCSQIVRSRVAVVINDGTGRRDRGSRAAATALGIRCASIHRLPWHSTLGPERVLPLGRGLDIALRRRLNRLCLSLWSQTQTSTRPAALSSLHPLEHE